MNNHIAFDKKNSKIALKPIKILNSYNDLKQNEILKNNNDIFSFLTEKSKVSRNNVLINLLKSKKRDYNNMLSAHQKMIEELKKNIDSDETNFQILTKNQKISSRKLEEMLSKLLLKKRDLLIEEYYLNSDIRVKEDERIKILEHINEYQTIAKFVTKALGGKGELFNYEINFYNLTDDEYHYDKETTKLLNHFQFLLNDKFEVNQINKDDLDIYNEIFSLNDSELLFHQLWKKEENILNNLKRNEMIEKEIVKDDEKNESILIHLKNRISILEKELKFFNEIYEREYENYKNMFKLRYSNFTDFEEIITDLYDYAMNIKNKNPKRIIDVDRFTSALNDFTIQKEEIMNKLETNLEKYEKEDNALFNKIINNIKIENS